MPHLFRFQTLGFTLTALVLTACVSTPDVYGPATDHAAGVGYSDTRIEDDRWRIRYTGRRTFSKERLEALTLRRAGELTRRNGYEWFIVVSREEVNAKTDARSFMSGSGVNRRISTSMGASPARQRVLRIEIIAGRGKPHPQDAYDADAIVVPYF